LRIKREEGILGNLYSFSPAAPESIDSNRIFTECFSEVLAKTAKKGH
jgi:hypothetical protein